jgi:hypothetical protein
MPIEAVGAFEQLAAKPDPTIWLRQEAISALNLEKLDQRWHLSAQQTTPLRGPRPTGVPTESVELCALVVRQAFTDREPLPQTNLARVVCLRPRRASPTPADDNERIRENLTYCVIRDLIERDKIGRARELLAALPLEYMSDPLLLRLLKTVAPPTAKACEKQDIDRQKDFNWLRDHAREYPGQWVALSDGQLLAAAATLRDISQKVKALGLSHPPLLHRID